MSDNTKLRYYHAPVWSEPVIMEMGRSGRRGFLFPAVDDAERAAVGDAGDLIPPTMRRQAAPAMPELAEPEVLRHCVRLSQQTLGMIGISLFGTCTMKYNSAVGETLAARPELAALHPCPHPKTLQGVLEIIHELDLILRELSGMDQFVFQAGRGADASYLHACITRAYHAARGELEQRNEVIYHDPGSSVQRGNRRCGGLQSRYTKAGGKRLPVARCAVGGALRSACLFINNPDDMGIYNPDIKRSVPSTMSAASVSTIMRTPMA
jgi:glycine dehydrogenase subunit 2